MSKNILIIGANSLIGQEVINLAQAAGDYVIATSRSELATPADTFFMLDPNEDLSALDELPESIDALLYCPGSVTLKSIQRLEISDIQEDMKINFEGAFHIIKKVLPNLKKGDGASVVFISSVAATTGMTFHSSIASSKAALEGLAKSLAAELAPRVAVNCLAPSLTNTPLVASLLGDEKKVSAASERHPLNAIGDPAMMAKAAYNLLSAKEQWMTGQTIHIDGGLSSIR